MNFRSMQLYISIFQNSSEIYQFPLNLNLFCKNINAFQILKSILIMGRCMKTVNIKLHTDCIIIRKKIHGRYFPPVPKNCANYYFNIAIWYIVMSPTVRGGIQKPAIKYKSIQYFHFWGYSKYLHMQFGSKHMCVRFSLVVCVRPVS